MENLIHTPSGLSVRARSSRKPSKYPFAALDVGQSFTTTGIKKTTMSTYICAYIKRHPELSGRKFKAVAASDAEVGNVIVTRLK